MLQGQARQHHHAAAITSAASRARSRSCAGMHPALFMVAGLEIPYGKNEYDAAGGLLGEPVEVIQGR